jgi:hypothetical protein
MVTAFFTRFERPDPNGNGVTLATHRTLDNDGIPDHLDPDDDGDGILPHKRTQIQTAMVILAMPQIRRRWYSRPSDPDS